MKNFYIITNEEKDPGLALTEEIRRHLVSRGCVCAVRGTAKIPDRERSYRYTDAGKIPEGVDCVLVLGGDGTLLQASRDLVGTGLPLLGINLGTMGFLAQIDREGIYDALGRLLSGKYSVEERMMLDGIVTGGDGRETKDLALNDIVIMRRGKMHLVELKISVDGSYLCTYRADGIIASTPTGSTGYSLSAGGPVISPAASLILLTAVAPHTLNSRPVVLPDDVKVTVEIGGRGETAVSFDGDPEIPLSPGSRIEITRSALKTRLIRINETSFVEQLRNKMK